MMEAAAAGRFCAPMDEDLRQWLSEGDRRRVFDALVPRYRLKVFRLVFSIVGNAARAEEVAQDAFLKIWLALDTYDGRAALSTWIYTIARNTALTHRRAEAYRAVQPLDSVIESVSQKPPAPELLDIDRMMTRLPEEQQEAVRLFYLQERSIEDVAGMMDAPEGTVKSYLYRARRALAKMMEGRS
jgi:RNA polymerase sigma-70 factor (ECF subfamily)